MLPLSATPVAIQACEAAEHINKKYRHFRDDIDTPEKFIELCATGSLMTGKAVFYYYRAG